MKIACIGNMNNNMFCLVRYLRDNGYDAQLLLVDEFEHFLPEADSYDDEYKGYTRKLDWYWDHWNIKKEKMRKDMQEFDFIIACDRVPGYLYKAGIDLDLFIPHGGDLQILPFYSFKFKVPEKKDMGYLYFTLCQKLGIRNAKNSIIDSSNNLMEDYVKQIKLKGKRFVLPPLYLYINQYTKSNIEKSNYLEKFKEIRSQYNFVVFQHCRQMWKYEPTDIVYKGNQILIKAFAKYLQTKEEHVNPILVLFAYGPDVNASKQLIESLNISNRVIWMPLMNRKDLMVGIEMCDIGVGELGRSWLSYGSLCEILTMKKPFIGYREDSMFLKDYPELYPMASANTPEEVEMIFHDYIKRPEYYKKMGEEAYKWVVKYLVDKPMSKIVELIEDKKKSRNTLSK